jgi:hypothetical protein
LVKRSQEQDCQQFFHASKACRLLKRLAMLIAG